MHGIFAAVPYCIDLIGGYIETNDTVCRRSVRKRDPAGASDVQVNAAHRYRLFPPKPPFQLGCQPQLPKTRLLSISVILAHIQWGLIKVASASDRVPVVPAVVTMPVAGVPCAVAGWRQGPVPTVPQVAATHPAVVAANPHIASTGRRRDRLHERRRRRIDIDDRARHPRCNDAAGEYGGGGGAEQYQPSGRMDRVKLNECA